MGVPERTHLQDAARVPQIAGAVLAGDRLIVAPIVLMWNVEKK